MSLASVMFLCHSLLSSSFGILNLSFACFSSVIAFCHFLCYPHVMCFCILHLAFDLSIFHLQSTICRVASVILFCHVLLSFSCRFFGHFPLSLSSVMLFCRVLLSFLLSSSFGILKLLFTVVSCSCHFLTWAREEGHG